jgi:hypothetical protein
MVILTLLHRKYLTVFYFLIIFLHSNSYALSSESFKQQVLNSRHYYQKNIEKKSQKDEFGTDIALKEKAREVEKMLYSVLWGIVFSTSGFDGSNTEGVNALKLLAPELLAHIVNDGMNEKELGDIADCIYKDLIRMKISQSANNYEGVDATAK